MLFTCLLLFYHSNRTCPWANQSHHLAFRLCLHLLLKSLRKNMIPRVPRTSSNTSGLPAFEPPVSPCVTQIAYNRCVNSLIRNWLFPNSFCSLFYHQCEQLNVRNKRNVRWLKERLDKKRKMIDVMQTKATWCNLLNCTFYLFDLTIYILL